MMLRSTLIAGLLIGPSGACLAALGGAPEAGASATSAATSAGMAYTRLDTTQANGARVREFVAVDGKVFAVAWDGPFLPDLRTLLGPHFDTLNAEAARAPKAGRSQLMINRPELVLFSGGHARAFIGHAWLPARLPAGFDTADVR